MGWTPWWQRFFRGRDQAAARREAAADVGKLALAPGKVTLEPHVGAGWRRNLRLEDKALTGAVISAIASFDRRVDDGGVDNRVIRGNVPHLIPSYMWIEARLE